MSLKIGDKVKIVLPKKYKGKPPQSVIAGVHEWEGSNYFPDLMQNYIGKTGVIEQSFGDGCLHKVRFDDVESYTWPESWIIIQKSNVTRSWGVYDKTTMQVVSIHKTRQVARYACKENQVARKVEIKVVE